MHHSHSAILGRLGRSIKEMKSFFERVKQENSEFLADADVVGRMHRRMLHEECHDLQERVKCVRCSERLPDKSIRGELLQHR